MTEDHEEKLQPSSGDDDLQQSDELDIEQTAEPTATEPEQDIEVTVESVIDQYLKTVRPMHLEFVEPSKRYADVIIPEGGFNRVAMTVIAARLKELLRARQGAG